MLEQNAGFFLGLVIAAKILFYKRRQEIGLSDKCG